MTASALLNRRRRDPGASTTRHRPRTARRHRPRPRAGRRAGRQPARLAQGLGRAGPRPRARTGRSPRRAIADLRGVQGLRVDLATADPRTVAGLAMAGVPLLATGHQPRARATTLRAGAGSDQPDLDDALAREQHSVTTRRAALDTHSTLAWRARPGRARRSPVRGAAAGSASCSPRCARTSSTSRCASSPASRTSSSRSCSAPTAGSVSEDEVRGPAAAATSCRPAARQGRLLRRRAQRRRDRGRRRRAAQGRRRRLVLPARDPRPAPRPPLHRRRGGRHAQRVRLPRGARRHGPPQPPDRDLQPVRRRRHDHDRPRTCCAAWAASGAYAASSTLSC